MTIEFEQPDLFSFILKCYEKIDGEDIRDIIQLNNSWDFDSFLSEPDGLFLTYSGLIAYLKRNKIDNEFENKRFISALLDFLDRNIHGFKEYDDLFKNNDDSCLHNSKYTLIIATANSIQLQMDKLIVTKQKEETATSKGKDKNIKEIKGLRKRRRFNPSKTCYRLGFKHLNFVRNSEVFQIKQSFCWLPSVSKQLANNIIKVGFFPFVKLDENCRPLLDVDLDEPYFTLKYRQKDEGNKEYEDIYLDYLVDSFKGDSNIIIFPENSIPFSSTQKIENVLKRENIDVNKLIVAGTNWNNYSNVCYVFDDNGYLRAKQSKFNPYEYNAKKEKKNYIEELKNESVFQINILHIKDFGIVGFPICSDLTSSKYIESIYCDCDVNNLFIPCMSNSKDIFSSLPYITSQYLISIFVCNTYYLKNNIIAYYSLPTKDMETAKRSYIEEMIKCRKVEKNICNGVSLTINLNNFVK